LVESHSDTTTEQSILRTTETHCMCMRSTCD